VSRVFFIISVLILPSCSVDSNAIAPGGGADGAIDALPSDSSTLDTSRPMDGASDTTPPTDTSTPDADLPDAPPTCASWMPRHFDACAIPAPTGALAVSDGVYDTDTGTLTDGESTSTPPSVTITQGDGTAARVISVDGFTVTTSLRAVGSMPLIVASWSTITIEGDIDVTSRRGGFGIGAGGNDGACTVATSGGGGGGGTGGGGGGGFGGRGGDGGDGDSNTGPVSGGNGGAPLGSTPTDVRGGCTGADAGPGTMGDIPAGGPGGGAIQLTAREQIDVAGRINAGGGGGQRGETPSASGGGGGGSGGYIGLDAPVVNVSGVLAANGGGGGGGAAFAEPGNNGGNGRWNANAAPGGAGAPGVGSSGGQGGANTNADGSGVGGIPSGGGGGGGGGVGFILVFSRGFVQSGIVSPPAMSP
jgi:hypothetical protein